MLLWGIAADARADAAEVAAAIFGIAKVVVAGADAMAAPLLLLRELLREQRRQPACELRIEPRREWMRTIVQG